MPEQPDDLVTALARALYAEDVRGQGADNSGYGPHPWEHMVKYASHHTDRYLRMARAVLARTDLVLPAADLDAMRRTADDTWAAYQQLRQAVLSKADEWETDTTGTWWLPESEEYADDLRALVAGGEP